MSEPLTTAEIQIQVSVRLVVVEIVPLAIVFQPLMSLCVVGTGITTWSS